MRLLTALLAAKASIPWLLKCQGLEVTSTTAQCAAALCFCIVHTRAAEAGQVHCMHSNTASAPLPVLRCRPPARCSGPCLHEPPCRAISIPLYLNIVRAS